jgi:type IV pilus assembly protein PilM
MNIDTLLQNSFARLLPAPMEKRQYGPIGIDIGIDGIRLSQFCKKDEVLELSECVFVAYDESFDSSSEKALTRFIKTSLRNNGFIGRDVVTCLQDSDTSIVMLNYLLTENTSDEEIIVKRMQERLENDLSSYVIDYMLVRPEGGIAQERSALVAVAEVELVVNRLEVLRRAGLNVLALEIEPMAIRRLISVKHLDEEITNQLTISIGNELTYLTVLSGRRLIYEREIDFGEYGIIGKLSNADNIRAYDVLAMLQIPELPAANYEQQEGGITAEEIQQVLKTVFNDLVDDINKALIYAASETRGMEVKQIYLTGNASRWNGVSESIQAMVSVPTSVLQPLDGFNSSEPHDNDTRNTIATGLALRGMTEVN